MSASADEAAVYGQAARAPEHVTVERPRCVYCEKLIAYRLTAPWEIKCHGCGRRQTDTTPRGSYENLRRD